MILDVLKHNLMRPDLVEAFIAEFHAKVNRQRAQTERVTARVRRELEQLGRHLDGVIEAIADGFRTPGTLSKLQELEPRKYADVAISMDGKGRWMDNVMIKRLWRSLKYECVYFQAFETGPEAKAGIASWID